MNTQTPRRLFEPQSAEELLRGWLLHCHKARDRHDAAAREYDTWRYRLGVPVVVLGAIVGTAVFASLGEGQERWITIGIGITSVTATVLAALQTFLDYPGRADRHRAAGVRYKGFIRYLEQALTDDLPRTDPAGTWIADLRQRLDAVEDAAPVVGDNIWKRVEARYTGIEFVPTALGLYGAAEKPQVAPAAEVAPAAGVGLAGEAPQPLPPSESSAVKVPGDRLRAPRRGNGRSAGSSGARSPG
jgi:hypothetical protein